MKNFTKTFTSIFYLVLLTGGLAFAQDTTVIDGGIANAGLLESTINGDTVAGGNRAHSNRVYLLKKDEIYYMESRIQFGGDNVNDSSSTLIIVGEEGGNKPVILMSPLAGGDAFTNIVHGSLTLKNIYWPTKTVTDKGTNLFKLFRANQTLRVEDCVTEFATHDIFVLGDVQGKANVFFKNNYFRDVNWFGNSWNSAVLSRGTNGEAIDTLWIENCTASNPGLTFFGKLNPVKFLYFNHNTIVNVAKYPFFTHQFYEAYFTNNLFINCNWEGECQSTKETQHPDGAFMGVTNLDTIDSQIWQLGHGFVPEMEDVKWFSSNNLHYTSPYLDKYYNGDFNTVGNHPISNRTWSVNIGAGDIPIPVENVPPMFLNDITKGLIAQYAGIIESNNYDNTLDPQLNTKGIEDQATGDEMAKFARNNYEVAAPGETYDASAWAFGDLDPTTIPGIENENGTGFGQVTDLLEDFSYQNGVRSKIDGRPLGSLAWWSGQMDTFDSDSALADVIDAYENPVGIEDELTLSEFAMYPVPAKDQLFIEFTQSDQRFEGQLEVLSLTGSTIRAKSLKASAGQMVHESISLTNLPAGLYLLRIQTEQGSMTRKFVKQ